MTKLLESVFAKRNWQDDATDEDWYLFLVPNVILNLKLALDAGSVCISHSFQRLHETVVFRIRESLWKISWPPQSFLVKQKDCYPLGQEVSHICRYFLFLSSHHRWFLDSLSRSYIKEKSRLNKDLMKAVSMTNQDRIHVFSAFSKCRIGKQNNIL